MMFTSRVRALSELGLAIWALQNDPWALLRASPDEEAALQLCRDALSGSAAATVKLEKWLKESAEGRGSFI